MPYNDKITIIKDFLSRHYNSSNTLIVEDILKEHPDFPIKERMIRYYLSRFRNELAEANFPAPDSPTPEGGITELTETTNEKQSKLEGTISSKETDRVKVLDEFLELTKTDLTKWKVKEHKLKAWDVTMKNKFEKTNIGRTYTNYYIAVTLVPVTGEEWDVEEFKDFTELMMDKYAGKTPKYTYQKNTDKVGENLLMLTINDLHLGRFVWEEECGIGSSSEIAERNAINGVNELLENASYTNIDKILYYVGHDYFTIDSVRPFGMTSNGTPQEVDMRWQQLFEFGEELQIQIIKYLSTIAPVEVQVIPGNHDLQTSFYLGRVLRAVFHNDENVTINAKAPVRKYFRFGECNLMGSHGKYEKPQDIHAIMMAEDKKNMGDTKYWYALFGHQHHYVEKTIKAVEKYKGLGTVANVNEDYKGLTITYLPNLSHRDDYEVERAYVGTIRSAMAMIFNSVKGRTAIFQTNL